MPVGLVVTKANSPTTPPATEIVTGKGNAKNKMISSIPQPGISYSETLKINVRQDKGEKIPDFLPPKLINLQRKLQILHGEWFEESMFKSDDVAALYAFYQPTQGPFIIVPSLKKDGVNAEFTLTSKS